MTVTRKKLIEVALPLDAINDASRREKSIRHGHPSTLHLWWARRPLAAARAVIFAQMVDDPSTDPDRFPTREAQERERKRLFRLLEELVQWANTGNETLLAQARQEIVRSWRRTCEDNADHPRAAELFDPESLPAFHDPFAGGGALPLEAQRLGLEAHASDLNPVAVLINKAMIEIPPKFAGRSPVNPKARTGSELVERQWKGARGLADDVRYYGRWMRDEAKRRIGHLYPEVEITSEMAKKRPDLKPYEGRKLTVIAWLWARTVKSPNPAFADVEVPLVSTWMLSTKKGKEAYVKPVIEGRGYRFTVHAGAPSDLAAAKRGTKLARGAHFSCLMSGVPLAPAYIKSESMSGHMNSQLMAIVADGHHGRLYLPPIRGHEIVARHVQPRWKPDQMMNRDTANLVSGRGYGFFTWADLFTPRQLVALTTFSDLVGKATKRVRQDAVGAGLVDDGVPLRQGGTGATAYAEAVAVYLAFALDKCTDYWNTIATWMPRGTVGHAFSKQAIPMTWDFPEAAPLGQFHCAWTPAVVWVAKSVALLPLRGRGSARQADAQRHGLRLQTVVSTDPPYYDNIGYADLSDFFYVWLRRSLKPVFPDLFATLAVPKAGELVATPYRHGGKAKAEEFFLDGMTSAVRHLMSQTHTAFPVTIYYAFKQAERRRNGGMASTGWETFLDALIRSGIAITGTWPMRTERSARSTALGTNALASSIVLVCRRRPADAPLATRREFLTELRRELPPALKLLQSGNIAPVDLAQAAIGPGMAVYTRYGKVLNANGEPMKVRDALAIINQILDESLAEHEGDFDADTRWALAWFEERGFEEGEFGIAETLSKAKNTSVRGLVEAGILESRAGKVRLLRPSELPSDWDPSKDTRLTTWEMVHHLIRMLECDGEAVAAGLLRHLGSVAEVARNLAYRLYSIAERKKRAAEALQYNGLVGSWPEIRRLASAEAPAEQAELF